ncbi:zinc finger CCHC domain-containing protein 2 isoform X1 [Oryzias latipes]|uniref:zinc finger CCHC domain-containing protein 2 isoform X1 n=1 Tax=Oryzias latipes TaxID=8090 RepID=UPI000CE1ABAA|nr:zinc finger CCHC domain-containing protein 2 isoform X1 [Oryzias latipes]
MLKMKLQMRTGEERGDKTPDDSLDPSKPRLAPTATSSLIFERLQQPPGPRKHATQLDKETVFEWFGLHSNPAKRIEFMCGLLHMCQPLELRFLGSYLEDLARKDYHVLRDHECRANTLSEVGMLTNALDPVVRSKLLVFLSLLGSDNRECAGILSRVLNNVDLALFYRNYDYSLPPFRDPLPQTFYPPYREPEKEPCELSASDTTAEALEQLALLFTMASLHPAFHFHQKEVVRGLLEKTELLLEEERRQRQLRINAQTATTELVGQQEEYMPSSVPGLGECTASHVACQNRRPSRWATQREAVHIEGIVLSSVSRTGADKEYNFEVKWSDSSSSRVTKTHHELENFLLKLPKDQTTESFEKSILILLNQGDQYESREVEKNLRERFLSAPPLFKQTRKVCSFFTCDSAHSSKPTCSICHCQPNNAYHQDCSDASSQEEEPYVQGHKKKTGSRSPCPLSFLNAKGSQVDTRRGGHAVEVNGPAEWRKKNCSPRGSHEKEQYRESEKRSHAVSKMKSRVQPADREKGGSKGKGGVLVTVGNLAAARSPQRKGGVSVPDTCGDTSSESYSSPSSPQHRGTESLDSEDDNNKDTDSHSDDGGKGGAAAVYFTDPAVVDGVHCLSSNNLKPQMQTLCSETDGEFPPLSFINPVSCVLPNGAADSPIPVVSPPAQSLVPDGKALEAMMVQMSLAPPAVQAPGAVGDPEKREVVLPFGISPFGLHPPANLGVHPLVQRFKTALPQSPCCPEGAPESSPAASHPPPVRAMRVMSPGPTSYSSPLLSCQDPVNVSPGLAALPHVDSSPVHARGHGPTLPSGMPSSYSIPLVPSSVLPSVGAPMVPGVASSGPALTQSPGPARSHSPSLVHSSTQSDCSSHSSSTAPTTTGSPLTLQQSQPLPPQQQQPAGCGTCGCHNNCGSRGGSSVSAASGCQAPFYFPSHQMATRHVFSVHPSLFQLTNLCSNSYLTQPPPSHQANGAATLPPFFATAPPPASPYLQSHSHSDMIGSQVAAVASAAAAAANYNIQQQLAPAASFCQRVYQHIYPSPLGMLPLAALAGGGVNKKNGSISCFNCGVSGHYAQDCNQPSMDSSQQGGFRLKYAGSHVSEALDNAD